MGLIKNRVAPLILCGGLGTRLRSRVSGMPKALSQVAGRPFLDYQLDWIAKYEFTNILLAAGYFGSQIDHYTNNSKYKNITSVILESKPLGTGGAIVNAWKNKNFDASTVLVINGDTYLNFDLIKMLDYHFEKQSSITMAILKVENNERFGSVTLNSFKNIIGFEESGLNSQFYTNAGVYIIESKAIEKMPTKPFSIEKYFHEISGSCDFYGYKLPEDTAFIDIGTPDSYDFINANLFNVGNR
jgi:D-glycero-alpha-D-manno-heptose 1-phosphate guanylyltransferase